jgi:hypothetical protein
MQRVRQLLFIPSHAGRHQILQVFEALLSAGQRDGTLIFCFADYGEQALSHGLVESDDADWELYDLCFFFPCEVCLQDTRKKGKK